MRTKALLCAAALAAGAATSMAQTVYSLNVVGYINVTLTNGMNLIANQLDVDGTMTNNTLATVFGTNTLPNGTKALAFDAASGNFTSATYSLGTGKWSNTGGQPDINAHLSPGSGVFVSIPTVATTPITLTLVGQVIQGTNLTPVVTGLQTLSSIPPIAGGVVTTLAYPATKGDKFLAWDVVSGNYFTKTYGGGTTWSGALPAPGEPQVAVGQAFMYNSKIATNWTQAFTVQ
jgi:hypothetical protein